MKRQPSQTILFCPLHWGLGHIARDLPLIREFYNHGHRVIVAASPKLINWLKTEIPDVETVFFDGPEIRYSNSSHLILKLLSKLPGLITWPFKERKRVKELVKKYKPNLIVSDNRYGARHSKVFSVIITHQLMIKMPPGFRFFEYPLHLIIKLLIGRFNECWIPDLPKNQSLAGDLVHKYSLPKNSKLIGPLSRFDDKSLIPVDYFSSTCESLLSIISGPEPQRSILEQKIRSMVSDFKGNATIITGTLQINQQEKKDNPANVTTYHHLPTRQMFKEICANRHIIARAGYSTIMDMHFLNRSIWLIPTPGQTEQIYLARYHHNRSHNCTDQDHLYKITRKQDQKQTQKADIKHPLHFREALKMFFKPPLV